MRVTKQMLINAFYRFVRNMGGQPTIDRTIVGGYRLVQNQFYGWQIEQVVNESGGITYVFGSEIGRTTREMYDCLKFANLALEAKG